MTAAAAAPLLVATTTRTVGRRTAIYAVAHLPDPATGRPHCSWAGPVVPMSLAQAAELKAVACTRCPKRKSESNQ